MINDTVATIIAIAGIVITGWWLSDPDRKSIGYISNNWRPWRIK